MSMSKTKLLVISPPDEQLARALDPLHALSDISISNDQSELERLAQSAEVILVSSAGKAVNFPQIWQQAKSTRWVHSLSAGVEKLLFPAFIESTVPLTNARGVYKRSLAVFALLGIMYHYKRVRLMLDNQFRRKWAPFTVEFTAGRVMGIVGYGETGRECALLAKAVGMTIHALRRNPDKSSNDPLVDRIFGPRQLQQMLSGIDVLLCAAPLTAETRHMIGHAQFEALKPNAILINLGRGPVVDESALITALQNQKLLGASLDVFEEEPLPEGSPLWGMENVLISPHCTDWTLEPAAQDLTTRFFVENFQRYQRGEPLENVVNKRAGY
jgi:phosphoglycerate dehydrogenase-like enzyme